MVKQESKTSLFLIIEILLGGSQFSCTSILYNQQAQADISFMEQYDKRSDQLGAEISRVNKLLSIDSNNTDLISKRDSLIIRKLDADKIREQARRSAIKNAEKGRKSSPFLRTR